MYTPQGGVHTRDPIRLRPQETRSHAERLCDPRHRLHRLGVQHRVQRCDGDRSVRPSDRPIIPPVDRSSVDRSTAVPAVAVSVARSTCCCLEGIAPSSTSPIASLDGPTDRTDRTERRHGTTSNLRSAVRTSVHTVVASGVEIKECHRTLGCIAHLGIAHLGQVAWTCRRARAVSQRRRREHLRLLSRSVERYGWAEEEEQGVERSWGGRLRPRLWVRMVEGV